MTSSLVAYYRCGDQPGSFSVHDSSGNNATGSLVSGNGGAPAFGDAGAFLYDDNGSLDCTNATNGPNGGFRMIDNTTEPPTPHNPLALATQFSFECWANWTAAYTPTQSASVGNGILFDAIGLAYAPDAYTAASVQIELQVGWANPNMSAGLPTTLGNQFMLIVGPGGSLGITCATMPVNVFDGNWHHFVY